MNMLLTSLPRKERTGSALSTTGPAPARPRLPLVGGDSCLPNVKRNYPTACDENEGNFHV